MKVLLKNYLPIFTGNLPEFKSDLCDIMSFVSGVTCTETLLPFFISQLKKKNPAWYSNTVALIDGINDVGDIEVVFNKCSLKDRKGRVGAKPREPRTIFHRNVPESRFKELTEPFDIKLKMAKDEEKAGVIVGDVKMICVNVPSDIYDYILVEVDRMVKEKNVVNLPKIKRG